MKYRIGKHLSELIFNSGIPEKISGNGLNLYIIDKNILTFYEKEINLLINGSPCYVFNAHEKNKCIEETQKIYRKLHNYKAIRESKLIGIGGGITTDITAYVASTYMRGCRLYLIPTTFVSMIDAAIGGKTGINLDSRKNNLGTFYPAERVYINPDFLKSLSKQELDQGWAECIKVALIKPSSLFKILLNNKKREISTDIIRKAIDIKAKLCRWDMEDKGKRRLLNLGHTFAHVLESISNYDIFHGNAVALGIRSAINLSLELGKLKVKEAVMINNLLDQYELPGSCDSDLSDSLINHGIDILLSDKKRSGNDEMLNLILLNKRNKAYLEKNINADKYLKILLQIMP